MPLDLVSVAQPLDEIVTNRANQVRTELLQIATKVEDHFFTMCELLMEAREQHYETVYGYPNFSEWVEQGSGLNISARQAYYSVNIAKKAKALGLSKDDLRAIGTSKLKEIFSLDTTTHAENIKALLLSAPDSTLNEVKGQVSVAKAAAGEEETFYITLRLDKSVKESYDKAITLARMMYGDQVDEHGEVMDASHSKCIEIIVRSYLMAPDSYPEGMSEKDLA